MFAPLIPRLLPAEERRARGRDARACVRARVFSRGKGEFTNPPPSSRLRRASLTVNTGHVERRAGLNWHQLPAKHPSRTFHPLFLSLYIWGWRSPLPVSLLPLFPLFVRPLALTPAVRGIRSTATLRRTESPPLSGATILHYENIHPQLT